MPKCYRPSCGNEATAYACLTTTENAAKRESHREGAPICQPCLDELNAQLALHLGTGARVVTVPIKEDAHA